MRHLLGLIAIGTTACGGHGDARSPDAPAAIECTATQTMCDGACIDVMIDINHCGRCGHVCGCGSTSCSAGICDAHVLAPNQGAPMVLALHADKLYWGTDVD